MSKPEETEPGSETAEILLLDRGLGVANDNITAWDREIEAYHQISSATKKLVVMPNASHMSLYSERTHLEIAAEEGTEWFKEHLGTPVSAAPGAGQNL